MTEPKEKIILKIKASLRKAHPGWSEEKVKEAAFKIYNARVKKKELTMKELVEEDGGFHTFGFIATTHKDNHNEKILPSTLYKWADDINGNFPEARKGDYHHDRNDIHLVSIADYAEVVELEDGHHGLWVSDYVNSSHPMYDTYKKEIEDGFLPAYSIEYDSRNVVMDGDTTYITPDCDLWGYAHASRPVNMHALKTGLKEQPTEIHYGRFPEKTHKEETMAQETKEPEVAPQEKETVQEEAAEPEPQAKEEAPAEEPKVEVKEEAAESETVLKFKEEIEQLNLQMKEMAASLSPKEKVLVKSKEETMDEEVPLRFKEMKEAVGKADWMGFKEKALGYVEQSSDALKQKMMTTGIPLNCTMKMKSRGSKIEIVGGPKLQYKDILNTQSNPGAYTELPVEFADVFQPGIVEQFNNAPGLLGVVQKRDHLEGSSHYGFTIETTRNTAGGAVDPDNVDVETGHIGKLKLRQEIKVYRYGVSVADYTLYHSRASLGDLFQLEVDKAMEAWMDDVHGKLYAENVGADGNVNILGLEAVADSAGNTSLYGKTRSAANKLAPDAAGDTYLNNNGAIVAAELRQGDGTNGGIVTLQEEGTRQEDILLVMNPRTYSFLLNLEDTNIRYPGQVMGANPGVGFNQRTQAFFDGYPLLVDHKCTSTLGNPIYVIDMKSWYMVMSKAPQLTGLAKVSAATSAYIEGYITTIYEQPRRIFMYDNNTGPTS